MGLTTQAPRAETISTYVGIDDTDIRLQGLIHVGPGGVFASKELKGQR